MKYFTTALTILVSATVVIAQDNPSAANTDLSYTCQTSSGSPLLSDVRNVADKLSKQGQQKCAVSNGCTRIGSSGTAAVDVCGPNGWYMSCYNAGRYVYQLADKCQQNIGGAMRVGGIFNHSDGKGTMTVYHA